LKTQVEATIKTKRDHQNKKKKFFKKHSFLQSLAQVELKYSISQKMIWKSNLQNLKIRTFGNN